MGDVEKGKKIFTRLCGNCHTTAQNGAHKAGPNLHGIFDMASGTIHGYKYSEAFTQNTVIWSEESMNEYLKNPKEYLPGTKSMMGVKSEEDRKHLIAYMVEATQ